MQRTAFIAALVLLAYLYRLVYVASQIYEYRDAILDAGQLYSVYALLLFILILLPLVTRFTLAAAPRV